MSKTLCSYDGTISEADEVINDPPSTDAIFRSLFKLPVVVTSRDELRELIPTLDRVAFLVDEGMFFIKAGLPPLPDVNEVKYITMNTPGYYAENLLQVFPVPRIDAPRPPCSTRPIVILASGQSNMQYRKNYNWTPPANLLLWGWDGAVDTDAKTGTAFAPMPGSYMNASFSFGASVAENNPLSKVYVINISRGGLPISHWITNDFEPYRMIQAIDNNVTAALAKIGMASIDCLYWWQGESDAESETYVDDFNVLHTMLRDRRWFPHTTPILINSTSPYAGEAVGNMNDTLRQVADAEPATRIFCDATRFSVGYWEPAENFIHGTAQGYRVFGESAWDTWNR